MEGNEFVHILSSNENR